MEKLIAHSWPGNVRELQNILKRCIVIGNWEEVVDDLYIKDKPDVNSALDQKGPDKALNVDTLLDIIKTNSPFEIIHISLD
ncbi:MAG TPA: hypothetical protein VE912_12340 [Bacteroidales bacterium]|nr:hypothetical protein [Bacteroidales bacterium]